ncbi:MAG: ribosome small subunit-dependent GTPase A [Peptostreptococcaceae bacterium]|nr:ribosome small subunit-dependent GTPase A [Peptostreptococcaceae bacterium]
MPKGRIIKALSGFYYVSIGSDVYECKLRGVLKREEGLPLVGDFVEVSIVDEQEKEGVIEKVEPRTSSLLRPPIANVTKALLIFGVKDPRPNLSLIDRFIVHAEKESLEVVLCFNKIDLDQENFHPRLVQIYRRAGYKVLTISAKDGRGIEEIRKELRGHVTVVAGPSGVGKTSVINALDERLNLRTSHISAKLGRGRHTTRYASLIDIGEGSLVADTPGFSSLSLEQVEETELKEYFIEFHEYDHDCRFGFKCLHEKEPGCRVRQAEEEGEIAKERYQSYLQLLGEVREAHRRKY